MPLKEEHINEIDEIRKRIREVIVSFFMAPIKIKKRENYVGFTTDEIADFTQKRIREISNQSEHFRLTDTGDIIGEVRTAIKNIFEEQKNNTKYAIEVYNNVAYRLNAIEWRDEMFYYASKSQLQ